MTTGYRLLFLGDARSIHLQRFIHYFSQRGDTVLLLSLEPDMPFYDEGRRFRQPQESRPIPYQRLKPRVPFRGLKYASCLSRLQRAIRSFKPDLVNAHFLPNYGLLGALSGFQPLIITVWGSDILLLAQRSLWQNWRARWVLSHARAVICDANMLVEPLLHLGVNPKRIIVSPFGVNADLLEIGKKKTSAPNPFLVRLNSAEGLAPAQTSAPKAKPLIVLSTRQLEPLYAVQCLLNAIPLILQKIKKPTEFWIAGSGSQQKKLETLCHDLQITRHVKFLGWLSPPAYRAALSRATIYVSCSRSDSTSVSLLEAMAAGLAPIVTDIAGNREWIIDQANGFLFPVDDFRKLADQIADLIQFPQKYEPMRWRNLKIVQERARWTENMQVVSRAFDHLIAEKKSNTIVSDVALA